MMTVQSYKRSLCVALLPQSLCCSIDVGSLHKTSILAEDRISAITALAALKLIGYNL